MGSGVAEVSVRGRPDYEAPRLFWLAAPIMVLLADVTLREAATFPEQLQCRAPALSLATK